jgi:hypothetical protein
MEECKSDSLLRTGHLFQRKQVADLGDPARAYFGEDPINGLRELGRDGLSQRSQQAGKDPLGRISLEIVEGERVLSRSAKRGWDEDDDHLLRGIPLLDELGRRDHPVLVRLVTEQERLAGRDLGSQILTNTFKDLDRLIGDKETVALPADMDQLDKVLHDQAGQAIIKRT